MSAPDHFPVRVFAVEAGTGRLGIAAGLSRVRGLLVVGEAEPPGAAGAIVAAQPDVVVLAPVPDDDYVRLARTVRRTGATPAWLRLGTRVRPPLAWTADLHGPDGLGAAIHRAAGRLSSPDAGPLVPLSPQELRVLALVANGLTNREIGRELHLAEKTVRNYVSTALAKLGLHRRTQAVALMASLAAS
jgi:two-component system, NarL family, response regulator DevR